MIIGDLNNDIYSIDSIELIMSQFEFLIILRKLTNRFINMTFIIVYFVQIRFIFH